MPDAERARRYSGTDQIEMEQTNLLPEQNALYRPEKY